MRTVVLVGCSATKRATPAAARDLYTSPLFRLSRRLAELQGHPWLILSAKHGVVDPGERLHPYNLSLGDLSRAERAGWSASAARELTRRHPRARFILLAGSLYRGAVADLPPERLSEPLKGLGLGRRLRFLKQRVQELGNRPTLLDPH